jgi:DNA topoisomerase-6 subunit B
MVKEIYREASPSEFFYRNRQLAGFSNPSRALYTTIRELFENSLDACELHRIKPNILISLRQIEKNSSTTAIYKLYIQDNGSGIPKKYVLDALGKVFFSSKYILRQSRGTFGLGGTMAILYAQATSGKPVKVITSTGDKYIVQYVFKIDIDRNKPHVIKQKTIRNKNRWRGTILELYLEGNYSYAARYIISYFKHTAAITPHAEITFIDPDGDLYYFRRTLNMVPKPPKETKPHPHGIDLETLKKMINNAPKTMTIKEFLIKNFHRLGKSIADKFLKYAKIRGYLRIGEIDENILDRLYKSLKSFEGFISPSSEVLSPIGEKIFYEGIKKEFSPEYIDVITRPPSSYQGHPFIIEAALAYGGTIPGNPGEIVLYRYANKIPLLFDEGSDVASKVLNNINMSNYKRPSDKPTALFVHIASTKIPFKTVGKEAIADVPEIEKEIELAFRYLLRRFTKYTRRIERRRSAEKRLHIFKKYLELIGEYSSKLAEKDKPNIEILIEKLEERYGIKVS